MGLPIAQRAKLLVLEDNDAVIATVIKGRSPVLKHCNRTQRIALDWLLERLQSDPGVSLRYASTHDQIADIFTKAAFQGPQWTHLVGLCTLHEPMAPLIQSKKGPASTIVLLGSAGVKDNSKIGKNAEKSVKPYTQDNSPEPVQAEAVVDGDEEDDAPTGSNEALCISPPPRLPPPRNPSVWGCALPLCLSEADTEAMFPPGLRFLRGAMPVWQVA